MTLRSVANISQAPNAGTPPLSSSFALTQTEQWGMSSSNPTMSMIYILYFITYTVHSDLESHLAIQIQVDVFIHIHIQTLASSSANIHELSRSKSSLAEIGGNPLQWHAMDLNLTAWWNYIQHLCFQLNTFRIVSRSKLYTFTPSAKRVAYITWLGCQQVCNLRELPSLTFLYHGDAIGISQHYDMTPIHSRKIKRVYTTNN